MRTHRRRRLVTLLGAAPALLFSFSRVQAAQPEGALAIAAAADLQFALPDIATAFMRDTGHVVRITFGSSGNLRRQIAEGAPFQLFLSADEDYVLALAREGLTLDEGVVYAMGRLALAAARDSPVAVDAGLADVRRAVAQRLLTRFAIANPAFAPYGRAAQEALTREGLWDAITATLVLGESVAQAAQFVATGNAQAGIISEAQARSTALAPRLRYVILPETLHRPLRQRMALLRRASPAARAFYAYMQSSAARERLAQHGFGTP